MKSDYPKSVNSQGAIAELIAREFGIRCQQQDITHWRALRRVGPDVKVPFPAPGARNRYDVKECFAWVEQYLMPYRTAKADEAEQKKSAKERLEEGKAALIEARVRKESPLYISKAVAERTAVVVIKKLIGFYKFTDENRTPAFLDEQLTLAGVTPEQKKTVMDAFVVWQQKISDQREEATAKAAEEMKL